MQGQAIPLKLLNEETGQVRQVVEVVIQVKQEYVHT
jgi:hypothetical protein